MPLTTRSDVMSGHVAPGRTLRSARNGMCATALAFLVVLVLAGLPILGLAAGSDAAPPLLPGAGPPVLLVRVVRTGPGEASVVGVATALDDVIDLFVDGVPVARGRPVWNLDYWFLHVTVLNGSIVQTRIGSLESPAIPVPNYLPPPKGPPGFVYASGTQLVVNGTPVQFFGTDEQTAFPYALIAYGAYDWADPGRFWGQNRLFPSGPDARIENVSTPDELWGQFFRYLLHYQNASSEPLYPRPNLLRIWIVDEGFGIEKAYHAWKNHPTLFWKLFDSLMYWADRAGVYLVPVLGHMDASRDNRMYDPSSPLYARHLELVRAIVARYNDNPRIAMWDLWNEADVRNDVYWGSVGGIEAYRSWASQYLGDVKPYSSNHLLTLGTGGWTLFPGVPDFGWQYHYFWNEIPGLEVSSNHWYGTVEDQYLIDWQTAWHQALGMPHFEGEYGYNLYPGPSGVGVGYWPWFTNRTRAAGWPAVGAFVLLDNGKGAYTDYPYFGGLPEYPPGSPPPPDTPPVAAFTASPVEPIAGERVVFNASISSDDFGIVRYEWRFSDGGVAEGPVAKHVFAVRGLYPVTLTVTDASGQRDSWTMMVRVSSIATPGAPWPEPSG